MYLNLLDLFLPLEQGPFPVAAVDLKLILELFHLLLELFFTLLLLFDQPAPLLFGVQFSQLESPVSLFDFHKQLFLALLTDTDILPGFL